MEILKRNTKRFREDTYNNRLKDSRVSIVSAKEMHGAHQFQLRSVFLLFS